MKKQIEKFYELTGYRLIIKDGKPYYDGDLDLQGTVITSLPDNLTVGGLLYLRGAAITSLPDNLTVGGWLDLQGTAITSLPDNLTVGGSLDLQGTAIRDISKVGTKLTSDALERIDKKRNQILKWEWNDKTYIKADGIFSLVVSQHGKVYRIQQIGKEKTSYFVTDGENRWSHGETIEEARQDLIYKISSRDTSRYNDMTLDSELTFEECIACYRIITGACAAGTRDYIENRLPKPRKEKYTIREMINLTKNEYQGKAFEEFFKNKN